MSVLAHVIASISPASRAQADAARAAVARAGAPLLERLAMRLGGAQHTARPRTARKAIVVAAGDHGCGDPGIALGSAHPTVVAAGAIADGSAALPRIARAPIVLVDAGVAEPAAMPAIAIRLGRAPTRDLAREPAMTVVDATLGLEAGIALAMSLASPSPAGDGASPGDALGLDLLAIGALGVGAEVASAALLAAVGGDVGELDDPGALAAARAAVRLTGRELLAAYGGSETAVLAGLILGAASINIPVILDDYATGAAALVAASLAPDVVGYLIAAHAGTFTQPRILAYLGLAPIFEVGLGHGEGTGAAMVLPLADQVAALAATTSP